MKTGRCWPPWRLVAIDLAGSANDVQVVEHLVGDDLRWTALGLAVGRPWHYRDSNHSAAIRRMAGREKGENNFC